MKKHHAIKKTKPRLFDDIVADQDLWLPGLKNFFGRERGMQELANITKPCNRASRLWTQISLSPATEQAGYGLNQQNHV